MKELLGYKMNGDETAVWKKLKNDVISELLSIHIPEMDEDYVASYVTDDFMGNHLPYVGVQGYKINRGYYFIEDDNRRPPKLVFLSRDYDEVKQRYIKEAAEGIGEMYVRQYYKIIEQKWESNTWSMTNKSTSGKKRIEEFETRKYKWDIEIYIKKELLPEAITAKDIKSCLYYLNCDRKRTWIYSEEDREFLVI